MLGEQVCPLLILGDVGGRELLVESALPGAGEKTWLFGPGWPEIEWLNACCGAPHLYLRDQVSRRRETPLYRPIRGWLRRSDLISEIGDQSGSSG
jgi:hypothetical protein